MIYKKVLKSFGYCRIITPKDLLWDGHVHILTVVGKKVGVARNRDSIENDTINLNGFEIKKTLIIVTKENEKGLRVRDKDYR